MASLVVLVPGVAGADRSPTPLEESLNRQTRSAWRLAHAGDEGLTLTADDVVIHLDGGARLPPDACEVILAALADHPEAVALYGDVRVGDHRRPRPAWSPTRVQSEPGASLPVAVRAGWPPFDPQDEPGAIEQKLADAHAPVLHLPLVLSSHPTPLVPPTTPLPDDPRFEPGGRPGTRRRRPSPGGQASVSVIIPSAGFAQPGDPTSMLTRCLQSLGGLEPPPLEVIVVVGEEFRGDPPRSHPRPAVRVVDRGTGPFDFSRAVNRGLLAARGELVLLLNDDIEAESSDWLGRMAAHLDDPGVGAVGAALLYPDHTVQHAGMVIADGHPLHPFQRALLEHTAAHGGDVARDVISVTGACLLARRRDLLALGGMSEVFPLSFGDVDLCLRLRRRGLRVVVEPSATLIHHESASRTPVVEAWEWERFVYRWGHLDDPWYHPAYWRTNDPDALTANADHRDPVDQHGTWPARSTTVPSRIHAAQTNLPPLAAPINWPPECTRAGHSLGSRR
ncbi:glycosyltransferase family 2 protein [Candidatus Poriferisocius sp.]|uniref:glycosyltransferase family 2 protein n=1 Tax=Candidatus Poriferisocius sp. TaxID=3101276 RepID=UPI003B5B5B15